ncbi:hypothetical protein N8828_00640 [bacterium]|jgi:hypothetical protein|nr:hypothetical protein [bacterium]
MSTRKYSEEHIKEWCNAHYPSIDSASDDVELEEKLKQVLIEGSCLFDKYPTQTNRTLHNLRSVNRYTRYFTNRAKVESLGYDNFKFLCSIGGSRYTNEYIYTTLLRKHVSEAIIAESEKLLSTYTK